MVWSLVNEQKYKIFHTAEKPTAGLLELAKYNNIIYTPSAICTDCLYVFNWHSTPQAQTLKRVEDAGEEENKVRERSEVQEGQTPSCPKEAAEAPDAEKSHPVLPPFIPAVDLPIHQEEHHNARGQQDGQDCHIGEVVGQ